MAPAAPVKHLRQTFKQVCAVFGHSAISDSLRPHHCSLPDSSVYGDSPGKNTGVGCHSFLQGIFPIQGSNSCLLHCRQILYHLSLHGSDSKIPLYPLESPLRNRQWHSHRSPGLDKVQFFQTYLPLLIRHLSPFSDWFNLSFPNQVFLSDALAPTTLQLLYP